MPPPYSYHYNFNLPTITDTHIVHHNLGDLQPHVIVYRNDTNDQIIPSKVRAVSHNVTAIYLFSPLAIRGKISRGDPTA